MCGGYGDCESEIYECEECGEDNLSHGEVMYFDMIAKLVCLPCWDRWGEMETVSSQNEHREDHES